MFWRRRRKSPGVEWLVVGLGNPEPDYAGTRHNLGFEVVNLLAARWGVKVKRLAYLGLFGRGKFHSLEVGLLKPLTYMNASGEAVKSAAVALEVPPERLIVVLDDLALPLGTVRVRAKGSAGGHKGLQSVLQQLGTEAVPRVRIGLGAPPEGADVVNWVLGRYSKAEAEQLAPALEKAADAVERILIDGVETAMNTFNRRGEQS